MPLVYFVAGWLTGWAVLAIAILVLAGGLHGDEPPNYPRVPEPW